MPDSNWVLQVGMEYAVSVQLFDKDGHKIFMADVSIYNDIVQELTLYSFMVISLYFSK